MLNGFKTLFLLACASILFATPGDCVAQAAQQNQQQNSRLTPQQQAAMQRAAAESRTHQQRAQQNYANQQSPQGAQPGVPAQQMAAMGPANIVQPKGFPLEAAHAKYVEDLLAYWEQNSKRVEKYKCNFMRYEYDTEIVEWRDPNTKRLAACRVTMGEIRFAAPDRARYQTNRLMQFVKPPQQAGGKADYKEVNDEASQEQWICDGKSLYEFDFAQKRLYETTIPKDMQGNVTESPLPFIFGADKDVILQRYWVRVVTPAGVENEYWLELFPKRSKDAQIYSKLEVVIAKEDFLPKAMHMYSAQYDPSKGNEKSRYFLFEDREVNSQLAKLGDFFGGFIRPRLPRGWKQVDTQASFEQRQATGPGQTQSPIGQPVDTRR